MESAKLLECDILFERDSEIVLRNGTKIDTDIFRLIEDGQYPTIIALNLYGKEIGGQFLSFFSISFTLEVNIAFLIKGVLSIIPINNTHKEILKTKHSM